MFMYPEHEHSLWTYRGWGSDATAHRVGRNRAQGRGSVGWGYVGIYCYNIFNRYYSIVYLLYVCEQAHKQISYICIYNICIYIYIYIYKYVCIYIYIYIYIYRAHGEVDNSNTHIHIQICSLFA